MDWHRLTASQLLICWTRASAYLLFPSSSSKVREVRRFLQILLPFATPQVFFDTLQLFPKLSSGFCFIQNGQGLSGIFEKKSNLWSHSLGFGADFNLMFLHFQKNIPNTLINNKFPKKKKKNMAITNHQPMVIIQRIPMANQRLQAASLGYQFCPLQTQARWIQQVRICLRGIQWPWPRPLEKPIKEKERTHPRSLTGR